MLADWWTKFRAWPFPLQLIAGLILAAAALTVLQRVF
jgi:hypothetical protein